MKPNQESQKEAYYVYGHDGEGDNIHYRSRADMWVPEFGVDVMLFSSEQHAITYAKQFRSRFKFVCIGKLYLVYDNFFFPKVINDDE